MVSWLELSRVFLRELYLGQNCSRASQSSRCISFTLPLVNLFLSTLLLLAFTTPASILYENSDEDIWKQSSGRTWLSSMSSVPAR